MERTHNLLKLQQEQFQHDKRNHSDIHQLHKNDRLKHYGLHFAKYVGRMARQDQEAKPIERTLVDTILVSLSAANTLHQNLSKEPLVVTAALANEPLRIFADAAGRFADACEKIDHVEEFRAMACKANADIMSFALAMTNERGIDLNSQLKARRNELVARQFFVTE